jgi:adenylate cyclase
MSADPPPHSSPSPATVSPSLTLRVSRARHDLHNSIGHILGFSEMLLDEVQEPGQEKLRPELELIQRLAAQMISQTNDTLDAASIEAGRADLPALQAKLGEGAVRIVGAANTLARKSRKLKGDAFKSDLWRITTAARKTQELARTGIAALSETAPVVEQASRLPPGRLALGPTNAGETPTGTGGTPAPLSSLFLARAETPTTAASIPQEGSILVVDDLEENRELLSRRLARLGYSVKVVESGERALEAVAENPADLILLDILMPGLDGIEVLRRLKADPTTRHIPVVMLSSADQVDTVVGCIKLGADDFLPKPFNATLLMARIESSLSKKRFRDQETAFMKRLQIEQDTSERLLLNILPQAIAQRLKQGEKVIADSFPEVTVLFSDFVDFTRLSTGIPPDVLVGRLNGIFSAFDQLCEQHGLEKIKTIGDAYMVVGGAPIPRANHAHAVADLALDMQRAVARSADGSGEPFRMRIGLNTGAVVAGVIGTKKFAYDLWGDTVNLASRMENHAPPGGILVTALTYERLREHYSFKPGRVIRVKGQGKVLTYRLLARL